MQDYIVELIFLGDAGIEQYVITKEYITPNDEVNIPPPPTYEGEPCKYQVWVKIWRALLNRYTYPFIKKIQSYIEKVTEKLVKGKVV